MTDKPEGKKRPGFYQLKVTPDVFDAINALREGTGDSINAALTKHFGLPDPLCAACQHPRSAHRLELRTPNSCERCPMPFVCQEWMEKKQ